ncbi:MAG: MFS transporter [Candidatus Hermodarchaeota archaeon]
MNETKTSSYYENLKIIFQSRNFVVILLTNYSGSLYIAAWIYLNLFFRDIGISYFELGIANSWSMLIAVFATLLGGYWADRYVHHRKYMAAFNKLLGALMAFIIPFVIDFAGVLIVWSIFSLAHFCQAALNPILFESLPPEQMGTGTSLFTLTSVFRVLGLTLVGIFIVNDFVNGLRLFWFIAAFGSLIDFIIRLKFLKIQEGRKKLLDGMENRLISDVLAQYKTGLKVLIVTIPLFFTVFLLDAISDIFYQFAQQFFLNEQVGMSYSIINYTMIGSTIIGVIGGLFAGFLLDKSKNATKIMFTAYFFLPLSILALIYAPIFPNWITPSDSISFLSIFSSTAFVAVVIKAGNDVIWRTIAWGSVGRELPREHTGKVMAILSLSIDFIGAFISPGVGLMYQMSGGKPVLGVTLMINLIILLLLFGGLIKHAVRKEKSTKTEIPSDSKPAL